jgi:predicted glycoside hydrolase/deacetylase ChbG (UPF0249 family)
MRHLIITADDYGYAPAYDAGIVEAARAGAIDSASVLVRRAPVQATTLLLTGVEVGLHLEFDATGAVAGGIERRSAQTSLALQLDRFAEAFGRPPAFLDGHHHCHAQPGLAGVVGRMAAELGLPVRSVDAAHRRLLRGLDVATPDLLVGRLGEAEPATPPELEEVLGGGPSPGGIVEWMVHPGHRDPASGSSYDLGREQDLRLLLDLRESGSLLGLRATHSRALGA